MGRGPEIAPRPIAEAAPPDLWALCALGCERELDPQLLQRLVSEQLEAPFADSMAHWLEAGWVRKDARMRGWCVAVGRYESSTAPGLSLRSGLHAGLLRRLAASQGPQALPELGQRCRAALGERSLAALPLALLSGSKAALKQATRAVTFQFGKESSALIRATLWDIVAAAFDAAWLETTWGETATQLGEQALRDALVTAAPVESLYAWSAALAPKQQGLTLAQCVAEHGLWRGLPGALQPLNGKLQASASLAWSAALALVTDSPKAAQARLDAYLAWSEGSSSGGRKPTAPPPFPASPTLAALLALLALSRKSPEGEALALRWVRRTPREAPPLEGWPKSGAFAAVGRSVRRLVKYNSGPEEQLPRLDAHQLPASATAWEVLLTGLTAQQHCQRDVGRAAWAGRMQREAARFRAAGYTWIAQQASVLADALADGSQRVESPGGGPPTRGAVAGSWQTAAEPGSCTLAGLLDERQKWRRPLAALAAFAGSASPSDGLRRVTWYVDMTRGSLSRPELETFDASAGWTPGPRVLVAELFDILDTLPLEDARILRQLAPFRGLPELEEEALDALCGHPRVLNGARGRLPVEVVRGRCHLQQRRQGGDWLLSIVPRRTQPGVFCEVESPSRVLVYRIDATAARLAALLHEPLRVPEAYANELGRVVASLSEHVEVQSAEPAPLHSAVADSTPWLRIALEAGAFWVEVGVRPFGEEGRFFPTGRGDTQTARSGARGAAPTTHASEHTNFDGSGYQPPAEPAPHAAPAPRGIRRDVDRELERRRDLLERCPTLVAALNREAETAADAAPSCSATLGEEEMFGLLTELSDANLDFHLQWQNTRPIALRGRARQSSVRGTLRRTKGWYIATGGVRIDGLTDVDLAELVRLPFTRSGRFVRLPSGDFIEVERRLRQALHSLALHAKQRPQGLSIPEAAFGALEPLLDSGSGLMVEPETRAYWEQLRQQPAAPHPMPEELQAELRGYQRAGYGWLCRMTQLGFGVCLADDMGLGKTLQVLAWLLQRKSECRTRQSEDAHERRYPAPSLVVAPTSVCSNWVREAARFAPSLRVAELAGPGRTALLESRFRCEGEPFDVLVASYGVLQQDSAELRGFGWDAVVLDEAQFIKNPLSLRARAAFGLRARVRVALSGTPVENHLGELWSLLHFLNPSLLGSAKEFETAYRKPIEREGSESRKSELKQLIAPFVLRRTKPQVLRELPPLTRVRHEVSFSSDEALRYAVLRRQIHEKLFTAHGRRQNKIQAFVELTRLRRFCCHPRLVFPEADVRCSKVDSFLALAEELRSNGHRALVFSQFVDFLNIVREQLEERGFRYQFLYGGTPQAERQAQVDAFQTGSSDLFLISLKAGGFGINLTAASYVIHLDPWWNPASEAQASDRAHRIGQQQPVTVYQLVAKDSIEERILDLHEHKRVLADSLLDDPALASADFNWQAIESLLG